MVSPNYPFVAPFPLICLPSTIPGPHGAGIFDPRSWGNPNTESIVTLELTRVVLAIGVFAVGVELPKAYMLKHWKSLVFLLVPVATYVCELPPPSFPSILIIFPGLVYLCCFHLRPHSKTQLPLLSCHLRMSHPNRPHPRRRRGWG